MKVADVRNRAFVESDLEQIIDLSLLAWEPVFESFERVLGPRVFPILHPDWRKTQKEILPQPALGLALQRT